jgi:hypothetical protein
MPSMVASTTATPASAEPRNTGGCRFLFTAVTRTCTGHSAVAALSWRVFKYFKNY